MTFWDTVLSGAISLLIVAAVTAAAGALVVSIRRWWGNRAVWAIREENPGQWILRNVTNRTMFEARFAVNDRAGAQEQGMLGVDRDSLPGHGTTLTYWSEGHWVDIDYIDGVRRSARAIFKAGQDVYRIRPTPLPRRRWRRV